MRYLKIPLAEADAFKKIPTEMLVDSVHVDTEKDVREYTVFVVIGDYSYVNMAIYDLPNKGKQHYPTEEENAMWDKIAEENPTWEIVTERPPQEDVEI